MNWIVALGALNGALAVIAGAFGAHGLKAKLTPDMLAVWQTGAEYHMYHALALLLVGAIAAAQPQAALDGPAWVFLAGILLFSGSLYLLAFSGVKILGAITPIGGLAFIVAWLWLALLAWRGAA